MHLLSAVESSDSMKPCQVSGCLDAMNNKKGTLFENHRHHRNQEHRRDVYSMGLMLSCLFFSPHFEDIKEVFIPTIFFFLVEKTDRCVIIITREQL